MSNETKGLAAGLRGIWQGQPANLRGAFWMVAAVTGFTLTAVVVRVLSDGGIDAFQSSIARSLVGLAIVWIWSESERRRPTIYADGPSDVAMDKSSIAATGGDQPHENMPPFTVVRCIIALEGMFPARS